eukprot:3749974-Alexandrium_andersonii.AAC.1
MSASLVGSEMCIRDRPARPGRQAPLRHCPQEQLRQPPGYARQGLHVGGCCLLYTSDAADDM